ncbi:(2Fe-2S)-binding protein [Rubellimicrobium arenae]|uniref:(2Fe-2S)-binding protein n=1 Tax=Rubellimicrobium arenae TaxID=2817372 RepID=UPI001B302618|nr:(2Fe-2S)-binding protein [Rubellimicrobium arenae]
MPLSPAPLDHVTDGPVTLAALAADPDRLDLWLAEHQALRPGMDRKAAGAFLLGGLVQEIMEPIAARELDQPDAAWPDASRIALRLAWARWIEGGYDIPVLTYRVEVDPVAEDAPPTCRTAAVVRQHGHLVTALAGRTGLSVGALWRLVTDSVAAACLEAGRSRRNPAGGMDLANRILGDRSSPLFNRQWGFFELDAQRPDGRCVRDWFRARGGCCRYYTAQGGEFCSTCVLRPAESRDALLRNWLASRADAA